ncbi:MAG: XRE family transcriptional regulator [Paracoccaceae bacterium]
MSDRSDIDISVGRTLARLRQERAIAANHLASRAGVSPAMVSRIENGQVSPSLTTLSALADALSVPVMALLAQNDHAADVHFVKAGRGLPSQRITPSHSHAYLLLGKHGGPGGSFDAAKIHINREKAGQLPSYQHEGFAFIYMLEGRATYRCGSEHFELEPGDSLSFDTKLSHGFVKITESHVSFLSVTSRPG